MASWALGTGVTRALYVSDGDLNLRAVRIMISKRRIYGT